MKHLLKSTLTILTTLFCLTAYGQDTLISVESSLLRSLYIDAIKYDSCKHEVKLLRELSSRQKHQLVLTEQLYEIASEKSAKCDFELGTTVVERDAIADEKYELEKKIIKKDKWINRLVLTSIAEGIVLFLLMM